MLWEDFEFLPNDPFPLTVKAGDSLSAERLGLLEETVRALRYHLGTAERAVNSAFRFLTQVEYSLPPGQSHVSISSKDYPSLSRAGDASLLSCATALDLGLHLVNRCLGLGIDPVQVAWGPDSSQSQIRSELRAAEMTELERALSRVYDSAGYHLLRDYRDWLLHRGAPSIEAGVRLREGILPLPLEAEQARDDETLRIEVEAVLRSALYSDIRVWCKPFVPALAHARALSPSPPREVSDPGWDEVGRDDYPVQGLAMLFGEPLQNAGTTADMTYPAASTDVVGETLVPYLAGDYVLGLRLAVRFVGRVLSSEFDDELSQLVISSSSVPISGQQPQDDNEPTETP